MFRLHWLVIDLRENRNLGLLSHVYMCNGRRDSHSRACSPRTVPARTVESVYGDHAQGTCRRVCGIMRHPGHVTQAIRRSRHRRRHIHACSPRTVPARTVESVYGDHAQGTCRRVCGIMRHPGHASTGDQASQAHIRIIHACSPRTVPVRTVESGYGDHAQGTCRSVHALCSRWAMK